MLENKTFNVPEDASLAPNGVAQPYVILGDEEFPLNDIYFVSIIDSI